ncbi:hypothetical protein OC835_007558, partial [Tilletia horrida]
VRGTQESKRRRLARLREYVGIADTAEHVASWLVHSIVLHELDTPNTFPRSATSSAIEAMSTKHLGRGSNVITLLYQVALHAEPRRVRSGSTLNRYPAQALVGWLGPAFRRDFPFPLPSKPLSSSSVALCAEKWAGH